MTASPVRHINAGVPAWQQLLVSFGLGKLYMSTAGPWIRQHVESLLGHPHTPAYKPPLTPAFLIRDYITQGTHLLAGQHLMKVLASTRGETAPNLLTTSAGAAGAAASAGAGQLSLAALRRISGTAIAMTLLTTAIDAAFANQLGPRIETTVNHLLGTTAAPTVKTQRDGTVPQSTVRTSPEQFVRNFGHSLAGSITYAAVLGTVGREVSRAVATCIAGPAGALVGGMAGALIGGIAVSAEDRLIGSRVADLMQDAYRGVAQLAGFTLGPRRHGDVIPVVGDRVALAIGGALVPYGTALATGQRTQYLRSIGA